MLSIRHTEARNEIHERGTQMVRLPGFAFEPSTFLKCKAFKEGRRAASAF
jgi:hypothetical protein